MLEERQQLEAAAREAFEACDTFVGVFPRAQEAREAGSRSALGMARNWESPGAARSSRADGSGREQPAAAWRWAPLATCLGGRAYPGSAGNREPLGELPKPREGGQYIIADLPTYEPAFGLVNHFA